MADVAVCAFVVGLVRPFLVLVYLEVRVQSWVLVEDEFWEVELPMHAEVVNFVFMAVLIKDLFVS